MNWHYWICEKQNETVPYLLQPKSEYFYPIYLQKNSTSKCQKKKKTKQTNKLKQKGKGKKRDDWYVDPFCILIKHYGGLKKKDHQH